MRRRYPSAGSGLKKSDILKDNMTYINKFDKGGKCSEEGHNAEGVFCEIAMEKGFITTASTREENMHKHIDYFLEGQDKTVSVDIKARKRTSRRDKKFNDDWVWLELKNVQGRKGWIYGEADFIVFEREEDFALVPRKSLIKLINEEVRFDLSFVEKAFEAKYRIYQRKGRRDQITQVKMEDVLKLKGVILWKK